MALGRVIVAIEAGMLDTGHASRPSHISAVLDGPGREELASALLEFERLVSQAKANAADRLARDGVEGMETTVILAGLSLPGDGGRRGGMEAGGA